MLRRDVVSLALIRSATDRRYVETVVEGFEFVHVDDVTMICSQVALGERQCVIRRSTKSARFGNWKECHGMHYEQKLFRVYTGDIAIDNDQFVVSPLLFFTR